MNYREVSSPSGYFVRSAEETDKVTATDRRVEFFVMGYARRPSEGCDSCKHVKPRTRVHFARATERLTDREMGAIFTGFAPQCCALAWLGFLLFGVGNFRLKDVVEGMSSP